MKENRYNEDVFFDKYSQMDRSKKGLLGAGEWECLEKMLPSFEGKRVLDLGCGYGWHCIYAVEHGADYVVGVDISEKMLNVAREKSVGKNIIYECSAIEDISYETESFDIIISSLAFHYLESFDEIAKQVSKMLKKGGSFVFSVEHPVFTAYGTQDWYYNENGEIAHFPIDRYFYEGKRTANFLGEDIIKYHKTLTTYISGLLKNGFEIIGLEEPKPAKHLLETIPEMKEELRRPMMLIIAGRKK